MKNKILRVFMALVVALPMFTSVLAVNADDLLDRLDEIEHVIEDVKEDYKEVIDEYPEVISALSNESKQTVQDLLDGKFLAEGMATNVKTLKAELSASTVEGADKVLSAVEDVQESFEALIQENKDVVSDVQNGYKNLTIDEMQEIVEKAVEVLESLGKETDVSETYEDLMRILNEAHKMAKNINVKLEAIIAGNVSTFESAVSKELLQELFGELKTKDQEAVIDTLIKALNTANGGTALKVDLKDVKADAKEVKNKLLELKNLNEQDLLMFTDSQKQDVANKIKSIEKDYVDFAKIVLDDYAEEYMDVVIDLAYDETVDQMIEYANEALDYYEEYKDTIDSLSTSMFVSKMPEDLKPLAKKAGFLVALGFVDTTEYNKNYIDKNFKTQIDNMSEYIAQEFVDYLDYVDTTINDEVMDTYQNGTNSEATQNELRGITAARFNTLTNLKALKTRVDKELLANREDVKEDLSEIANYVYAIYHENILLSTSATLMKENSDPAAKYECAEMDSYILTNKFMAAKDFTTEMGIPSAHKSVVSYANTLNSKIKTGSTLTIKLSEETMGSVTFAVLGDIYADGLVDARDYMVIKNYIMENEEVSKISLIAADTYRDKVIDARDYMAIKNYIMDGTEISL